MHCYNIVATRFATQKRMICISPVRVATQTLSIWYYSYSYKCVRVAALILREKDLAVYV